MSVNPAGLSPGVYTGAVTIVSPAASGPTQIPVLLSVRQTGSATAITAIISSLNAHAWFGGSIPSGRSVCASAGLSAFGFNQFSFSATTTDGGNWLVVSPLDTRERRCAEISFNVTRLVPGVYTGSVLITSDGQSLSIPIKLIIDPPAPPVLGSVVSAASAAIGAIAPGEIVTIRGVDIGKSRTPSYYPVTPDPPQVLFDGIPAQVLYAGSTQINAVVPNEIMGRTVANLEVRYGYQVANWGVPVATAAPGIFTLDSSGQGPGAVLNQDNSVNGSSNPARRGSVIQIFATGMADSRLAGTPQTQSVRVTIGGFDASVTFAGTAPGLVAGLFQVNAIIPPGAPAGPAIPIVISLGPHRSQDGVTIAVQ